MPNPPGKLASLPKARKLWPCDGDCTSDGASGSHLDVSVSGRWTSGKSEPSNTNPWSESVGRFFWHKAPLTANRIKDMTRIGALCFTMARSCKRGQRLLGYSAIQTKSSLTVTVHGACV